MSSARPIEVVARAMAKVVHRYMSGVHDDREQEWIDRHWPEYEDEARQLLRDLKGQPPHVTDAGASSTCTCRDCLSESLDSMLEAMARA